MKTYTKLLRIEYNHKIFDVFSDSDHRRTFLEVKIKNNKEEYYYPNLNDYINLELTYNKIKEDILCLEKYTFKNILITSGIITLLIANLKLTQNINNSNNYNLDKTHNNYYEITVNEPILISNNYYEQDDIIVIINNDALTELGYDKVSFDEVRNTLLENANIPADYREITNIFIDRLEERSPEVDLRVFNENLKTLTFEVIPNDKWEKDDTNAYYSPIANTITVKESYDEENTLSVLFSPKKKLIGFHELCHVLNNTNFKRYNDGKDQLISKRFYINNGYGNSISEGFTTILTDYLLTDNWENYFEMEDHEYGSYKQTSYICYQILKLSDDYNIYNYLNGNITEFESKLKEYNLENIIDALDANIETNEKISKIDEELLHNQTSYLLEYRINQLIDKGYDDLIIYDFALNIDPSVSENINICSNILNNKKANWSFRTIAKEKIKGNTIKTEDSINDTMVSVYDNSNNLLTSKYCNNFCIMVSNTEDTRNYNLIYIAVSDNELCYKDAFTNKLVDLNNCTDVIGLDSLLSRYKNCDFMVNENFLKSSQLDKYITKHLGINTNLDDIKIEEYNIQKR